MTAPTVRPVPEPDGAWAAEFRALLLEIDRRAVALDVRRWPRAVPGTGLSVLEHLQLLHARWRAVPVVAPRVFVREEVPVAAGEESARAVRPAAVLRTWRREGRAFPDRLAASYRRAGGPSADDVRRQYLAELAALRRCLSAFHAVTSTDAAQG